MTWHRPPRPDGLRQVSPAAMGLVLLALLNNAQSADTAVISWDQQDQELNEAVRLPVDAFAKHAAHKRRTRRERVDGYASTQAAQRLCEAFVRDKPRGKEMRGWVPASQRTKAMAIVADEVVVEKGIPWQRATAGMEMMMKSFEEQIPVLKGAHRLHSTPADRTEFFAAMTELFRQAGGD